MQKYPSGDQRQGSYSKNRQVSRAAQKARRALASKRPSNKSATERQSGDGGEGEDAAGEVTRLPLESPITNLPGEWQQTHLARLDSQEPTELPPKVNDGPPVGNAFSRGYKTRKRFRTPPNPPDKILLTDEEAAYVLDLEPDSLAVFRSTGRHGIPYIKIGRNVRYRRSDLEAWLISHTHTA